MTCPPYGWRLAPNGDVVRDAAEQAVIACVRALRAAGLTFAQIRAALHEAGVATAEPTEPTALEHLRAANVHLGGAALGANEPNGDEADAVAALLQAHGVPQ